MDLPRYVTSKDYMQREADDELEELERRLREQYEEAQRQLSNKLRAILNRYETQRAAMWAQVEAGIITQAQYASWCRTQILTQRVYQEQIDGLAHDLTNVDKIANAMINGELPEVYVSSYNFGLFRADMCRSYTEYEGANFQIYNVDALRILIAEDPDLIPWIPPELNEALDFQWNRQQLQTAVAQGILQGEHVYDIAERITPIVNNDEVAAIRTARTSFTSVENQGRRDASARVQAAGIPMLEPWLATKDARTRDTHLMLDGTLPNKDGLYGEGIIPRGALLRFPADPRGAPEQIYNCRCRVQSMIAGIDYSHDDELYNQFLHDNYYEDWLQLQKSPKVDVMREAVERQRQLRAGERVNREALIGKTPEERRAMRERAAQRRAARGG